jgi:hypothetical protein
VAGTLIAAKAPADFRIMDGDDDWNRMGLRTSGVIIPRECGPWTEPRLRTVAPRGVRWRRVAGWGLAKFRVPCHEGEVDRRLKVVELELQAPESWPDVRRDLLTKVTDNYCTSAKKAQKSAH